MLYLINDLIVDINPQEFVHPLDAERFSSLSLDYIAQLGKEMFALDPLAHRANPERARRLAFLLALKMPKNNAASFVVQSRDGGPQAVETEFKALNEMVLGMMYDQQKRGELNAQKVDNAVWHRQAA